MVSLVVSRPGGVGMEERPPGGGGRGDGRGDSGFGTGRASGRPVTGAPLLGAQLNVGMDRDGTTSQTCTLYTA